MWCEANEKHIAVLNALPLLLWADVVEPIYPAMTGSFVGICVCVNSCTSIGAQELVSRQTGGSALVTACVKSL